MATTNGRARLDDGKVRVALVGVAVAALLATAWGPGLIGRLRLARPIIANLL